MHPINFGKYLLLDRVNVGGMAEVYVAKTFGVEGFERFLAIKRILPNMAEDDEFINMFVDEARIAVQLSHANIVQIYELGKYESQYYIAMELVHGKDLRQIFEHYRKSDDLMPLPMAAFITSKICEGLDYAHRRGDASGRPLNVIHRDVSPQNILVSYEGEVKVTDFGIAKAEDRASKTQAGVLKGKFGYMSPEQVRGMDIDHRSDVFAVGILLYEMTTGKRLFVGESDFSTLEKVRNAEVPRPTEVNPSIPEPLEHILMRALAKEREERYQYASDLHDDLQQFLIEDNTIYNAKRLSAYLKNLYSEDIAAAQTRMEEYARLRHPGGAGATHPAPAPPIDPADLAERTVIFESGFASGTGLDLSSMPTAIGTLSALEGSGSSGPLGSRHTPAPPRSALADTGRSVVATRKSPAQSRAVVLAATLFIGILAAAIALLMLPGASSLGTLMVNAMPPDVHIYLDDDLIATETPLLRTNVPLGEHIVLAKLDGYKDKAYRVELVEGSTAELTFEMEPEPVATATAIIDSVPRGAEVIIDGVTRGATPITLDNLDPSSILTVQLRKAGYEGRTTRIAFAEGQMRLQVTETLVEEKVPVEVTFQSVPPGADVTIDDEPRGATPLVLTGFDPARRYQVTFHKEGYEPKQESFKLNGKNAITVAATLQEEEARRTTRRKVSSSGGCGGSSARLSVATHDEANCQVIVGKANLGVAPFFKRPAPSGRCPIVVRCPSGRKYTTRETLSPGEEAKLIVTSDKWR